MRFIGMDVHRDFCEVAIAEAGRVRSVGRVQSEEAELELFAASLGIDDLVALEVTGNAAAIARIIEPHVARVVLVDPVKLRGKLRAGRRLIASMPWLSSAPAAFSTRSGRRMRRHG